MSTTVHTSTGGLLGTLRENRDGSFETAHTQDISSILDDNKRQFDENLHNSKQFDHDVNKVASIPMVVALEWMKEGINAFSPKGDDMRRIKQKLNSPEFQYLRTRPGRL